MNTQLLSNLKCVATRMLAFLLVLSLRLLPACTRLPQPAIPGYKAIARHLRAAKSDVRV